MKRRNFIGGALLGLAGSTLARRKTRGGERPASPNAEESYQLNRSIPRESEYDLVVVGGGMAGVSAAIAAGRLGARVLLVEAMGNLGGMGTSGLVTAFDGMGDGERMLVGGVMREIVEEMYTRKHMPDWQPPDTWRKNLLHPTRFDPEGLKRLLDDMVLDAGVELRYFTNVVTAEADHEARKVHGVVLHNVEGLKYVPARAFVDASGHANLCTMVGANCLLSGKDTEHIMPPTLCGIYSRGERSWESRKYKDQAVEDHFFEEENDNVKYSHLIPSYSGEGTFSLNAGHVFDTDATKIASVTQAMVKGRKLSARYEAFFRKYVPGCEEVTLAATATLLGVRESRWIVGEYQLTFDDFIKRRKFPDQIAVFNKETDIHIYYPTAEEQRRKETTDKHMPGRGECYGIPYGILVPKGWKNLWTAGRCVSVDNVVHGSTRCMPSSAMMGQAAGTAAVQSVSTGQTADRLNTAELVKTLRANEAYLPQEKLSAEMTRS
jgi:hypothetical protein